MKKHFVLFSAFVFLSGGVCANGGELSYVPIPASQSDASSGISGTNQYTTALDGGSEANRVVNGATLYATAQSTDAAATTAIDAAEAAGSSSGKG